MQLIETLTGSVAATPKSAYRKLLDELDKDGVVILSQDDEARSVDVAGTWWFRGKWSFTPDETGEGATVQLQVFCKGGPVRRLMAKRPIQRTLRELRAGWDDDLQTLAQPLS